MANAVPYRRVRDRLRPYPQVSTLSLRPPHIPGGMRSIAAGLAAGTVPNMATMYTKDGKPRRVSGDKVFGPSGRQVGRIKGKKVFGPDGRYVGTIVTDRLVYRSTDSGSRSSPFAASNGPRSSSANRVGSAMWGDEPEIE